MATVITSENVSKLTTFELRQELVRRECLDLDEDKINHNSMLKRLMEELVKDEARVTEERTSAAVDAAQQERDAAKALRDKKKQEAIERSKARQSQKDYFKAKKDANVEPVKEEVPDSGASGEDEEEEEIDGKEIDPFRIGPSKGSKIHVS